MSSTIASSILRRFSAWRSSLDENGMAPSLVTPSTTWAISWPNSSAMRSGVTSVSSTTSCSSPAQIGHDVQLHVREEVRNLKRMNEIGISRMADLALVLLGARRGTPGRTSSRSDSGL